MSDSKGPFLIGKKERFLYDSSLYVHLEMFSMRTTFISAPRFSIQPGK